MKKILSILICLFSPFLFFVPFVNASTAGPTFCGTGANVTGIGTAAWTNPTNACATDSAFAVFTGSLGATFTDTVVSLIKGGTVSGSNLSTGAAIPTTQSTRTFGGSSNLWGLTLTPADVNSSTFGVAYVSTTNTPVISNYLQATNFGFAIPSTATINGITVTMVYGYDGTRRNNVDSFTITVTYTPAVSNSPAIFLLKGGFFKLKGGTFLVK